MRATTQVPPSQGELLTLHFFCCEFLYFGTVSVTLQVLLAAVLYLHQTHGQNQLCYKITRDLFSLTTLCTLDSCSYSYLLGTTEIR